MGHPLAQPAAPPPPLSAIHEFLAPLRDAVSEDRQARVFARSQKTCRVSEARLPDTAKDMPPLSIATPLAGVRPGLGSRT